MTATPNLLGFSCAIASLAALVIMPVLALTVSGTIGLLDNSAAQTV